MDYLNNNIKSNSNVMAQQQVRPVHPAITGIILVSFLYLLPAMAFWPEALPAVDIILNFVQTYQSLVRNIFLLLIILHLFEAVFAMMICTYMDFDHSSTLQWGLSVFVNGVFALRHLLSRLFQYETEQRKHADLFAATSNSYDNHDETNCYNPQSKSRRSSHERRSQQEWINSRTKEKSI